MLWRRSLGVLGLILLAAYAYAPLADTELVREDFTILASAADLTAGTGRPLALARRPFAVEGTGGHPLAGLSILLSHELWSDGGSWVDASPLPLRLEHLALLLLAAAGLGSFLRRVLQPWTGSDQARAAAWAGFFLAALHPFHVASLVTLAGRGHLLAAAAGTWAAAAFLRGRQERRYGLIVLAALLSVLAAASSGLGLVLPVLLAAVELSSAHRYRPLRTRLRTATTTFLVFSASVLVDVALRSAFERSFQGPSFLEALAEVEGRGAGLRAVVYAFEKLGLAFLPVNAAVLGVFGYLLAGGLVLAAFQPALVAARSAPRLWGWILCTWTVLLVISFVPDFDVRVVPADLSRARVLFPTSLAMAAALATAATALPGTRRLAVPALVAIGFAVLAHANGLAWRTASRDVRILRADLARALRQHGGDKTYLVIEPPGRARRVDALGDALPLFARAPFAPDPADVTLRAIELDAYRDFARTREHEELRAAGLVALYPRSLVGQPAQPHSLHASTQVEPPGAFTPPRPWFHEGRSPDLDLDPLAVRALRVTVPSAYSEAPPRAGWRSRWEASPEGEVAGTWLLDGAQPQALFELNGLSWLLGRRIRRVWSAEGWSTITEARFLEELPEVAPGLVPRADGDDWVFDGLDLDALETAGARGSWSLGLFDLAGLDRVELEVRREDEVLVAAGAAAYVEKTVLDARGPVIWTLQYRVDDVAVLESRGRRRRVGRRDSVEVR